MREALAEALSIFEGAIVMVSHDRHLIGLVCETFWRVHDGVVEPFDGDLDAYAAWLRSRPGSEQAKADKAKPAPAPVVASPPKPASRVNPHKLAQAEARVAELEARMQGMQVELADPSLYGDGGKRAAKLGQQQEALRVQLAAAESELLALYEANAA
jgi:ATP-binding cassette subfamily F protein 3